MSHAAQAFGSEATSPYDVPLDTIDVSRPELFRSNTLWP